MKIRLFVLPVLLAGVIACNQAPAGAPPGQETAPAGTAPAAGAESAPAGAAAPATAAKPAAAAPAAKPAAAAAPAEPAKPPAPAFMEMEVPAGTALEIVLETPVGSATSKVEDAVKGHVAKAVAVSGMTTIPAGSPVSGTVISAIPSGRVKGLASVTVRFNRVIVAKTPYTIQTEQILAEAQSTKGSDAKKVGVAAGAGAVIGAIAGGGKGAAIGTAVGGGAGAGVVMATKGKEIEIEAGTTLKTTINAPVKINAPM